ncbi:MAG: potassium channel family protein [Halolamina sp.]
MDTGEVDYEPVSVKAVLAEMKDTAELLVDLSYSAVLHGSEPLAGEVLSLEERMDVLQVRARMSLLLAARNPEDAETLAPVLGVVSAAEKISDAAGDIAKVVLDETGLPEAMRSAIPEAREVLVRTELAADSAYASRTLADVDLETKTGVRVIAIRRASRTGKRRWLTNPGPDTELQGGDVLILRGPEAGLSDVHETATGEPYDPPTPPADADTDLSRAVDTLVLMKDVSELAVDLSYGAVLFDSTAVAKEVSELEAEVDALKARLEAWVLRAAGSVADPVQLRGLAHVAAATEVVSDAALEISEGVLRGLPAHPVVAAAVEESDEVIVRLTVAADAAVADRTLAAADIGGETGCRVVAVRRPGDDDENDEWLVSPDGDTRLHAGDVLLAKGTRAGAERLGDIVGDPREFED